MASCFSTYIESSIEQTNIIIKTWIHNRDSCRIDRCNTIGSVTHLPTWTIFKKCTFGHSGKYVNHRIHAIFLIGLHIIYHIQAKSQKFAIEKSIHKKHLTCVRERESSESIQYIYIYIIHTDALVYKMVCSINYFENMLANALWCDVVSVYPKRGIEWCNLWVHCCLPLVVRVCLCL